MVPRTKVLSVRTALIKAFNTRNAQLKAENACQAEMLGMHALDSMELIDPRDITVVADVEDA